MYILLKISSGLKEEETCILNKNCDAGLHCETCLANNNLRPRCFRTQPINPISKVKGLPFNKYSWLTTHNSFARLGEVSKTGSITSQLTNGARGFMHDMYIICEVMRSNERRLNLNLMCVYSLATLAEGF